MLLGKAPLCVLVESLQWLFIAFGIKSKKLIRTLKLIRTSSCYLTLFSFSQDTFHY